MALAEVFAPVLDLLQRWSSYQTLRRRTTASVPSGLGSAPGPGRSTAIAALWGILLRSLATLRRRDAEHGSLGGREDLERAA